MLPHAARAMLSSLKEHSLDYLDGSCKFFAASPTGSTSISEFASKNLAFPATLVPLHFFGPARSLQRRLRNRPTYALELDSQSRALSNYGELSHNVDGTPRRQSRTTVCLGQTDAYSETYTT